MNRSCPGTSTNPISRPDGSVAPREAEIDREAAPLLLGPAIRIDAGEADDQRGLAVVDVAGGGDDAELGHLLVGAIDRGRRRRRRGGRDRSSSPSSAYSTARARCGTCSSVTVRSRAGRAVLRARQNTEGVPGPEAAPRTPADPAPGPGPPRTAARARDRPARRRRTRTAPRARPRARRRSSRTGAAPAADELRRLAEHAADGELACWPVAMIASTCSSAATWSLSMRTARASGWRRSLARRSARPTMQPACGPPSSLSPLNVTRSAPVRRARRGRWARRREPVLVVEQSGADVVEERDVVLPRERGQLGAAGAAVNPTTPVVRRVHLQDRAGLVARRPRGSRRGACGSWCRPRPASRRKRP